MTATEMTTAEMKALIAELDALAANEGLAPREAAGRLIQRPTASQQRINDIVFILGTPIEDRVNARIPNRQQRVWNDPRLQDEWWAELDSIRSL